MTYDLDPKDAVRLIEGIEERARAEERAKLEDQLLSDETLAVAAKALEDEVGLPDDFEWECASTDEALRPAFAAAVAAMASHPTPDGEENGCKRVDDGFSCSGIEESLKAEAAELRRVNVRTPVVDRHGNVIKDGGKLLADASPTPVGPASPVLGDEERLTKLELEALLRVRMGGTADELADLRGAEKSARKKLWARRSRTISFIRSTADAQLHCSRSRRSCALVVRLAQTHDLFGMVAYSLTAKGVQLAKEGNAHG